MICKLINFPTESKTRVQPFWGCGATVIPVQLQPYHRLSQSSENCIVARTLSVNQLCVVLYNSNNLDTLCVFVCVRIIYRATSLTSLRYHQFIAFATSEVTQTTHLLLFILLRYRNLAHFTAGKFHTRIWVGIVGAQIALPSAQTPKQEYSESDSIFIYFVHRSSLCNFGLELD